MTDLEEARALWRLCGDMTLPLTASDRARIANSFRAVIDMAKRTEEFDAFRREVSDAVEAWVDGGIDRPAYIWFRKNLERFILPKPVDPLVEALQAVDEFASPTWVERIAPQLRAALAARGLKIVEDKQ